MLRAREDRGNTEERKGEMMKVAEITKLVAEAPNKYRIARKLRVADGESWYYINPKSIHIYLDRNGHCTEIHLTRGEIANILSLMEKKA
jgi:predicted phosphatase